MYKQPQTIIAPSKDKIELALVLSQVKSEENKMSCIGKNILDLKEKTQKAIEDKDRSELEAKVSKKSVKELKDKESKSKESFTVQRKKTEWETFKAETALNERIKIEKENKGLIELASKKAGDLLLIAEDKIDLMNKEHLEKFDSLKTQANNELTDLDAEKRNGEADIKKNLKILEKTTKQIGLNNAEISEHKSLKAKNLKLEEDKKIKEENIVLLDNKRITFVQKISHLKEEISV